MSVLRCAPQLILAASTGSDAEAGRLPAGPAPGLAPSPPRVMARPRRSFGAGGGTCSITLLPARSRCAATNSGGRCLRGHDDVSWRREVCVRKAPCLHQTRRVSLPRP